MSHPMRVRGLKLITRTERANRTDVAPHAGAWIETRLGSYEAKEFGVAPHAGAWIETDALLLNAERLGSHPMRVRGLKHR